MAKKRKVKGNPEGIFIPAGLLIGIGLGFVYNNIPAGTLIGIGAGFLLMAVIKLAKGK